MKALLYLLNAEFAVSEINEEQVLVWLSDSRDPIEFLQKIKTLS